VVVARVVETEVSAGQRVLGTVQPLRTSTIGSAADGRVVEFLVNNGDAVQEDQPLARLRTDTLMIELAAAKAELSLYEQQLAELANGSRPEDIAEAQAKMLGAKAAMEVAAANLRRVESLAASKATSATALDEAKERAEFTRYVHSAAEALLKRVQLGPRAEQISQAEARFELQKQNVLLIEDRLAKFTIRAPFDGFVAAEFTEVGAWISQGDPIAQVIQLNEVEVESPVTAEYAVRLRPGDTIRVEFPELPDQLIVGTVDRIVPIADARSRTFPVYIRIPNQVRDGTPLLMAGMLARVELPAGQKQTMPLVPKDALVLDTSERSVYIVRLDGNAAGENRTGTQNRTGTVQKVPVDLGVAVRGRIQIRGNVSAGDLVVVVGNERLRNDDRVQIQWEQVDDETATQSVVRSADIPAAERQSGGSP
jgi:RND family efflux transporter MFP subunit